MEAFFENVIFIKLLLLNFFINSLSIVKAKPKDGIPRLLIVGGLGNFDRRLACKGLVDYMSVAHGGIELLELIIVG